MGVMPDFSDYTPEERRAAAVKLMDRVWPSANDKLKSVAIADCLDDKATFKASHVIAVQCELLRLREMLKEGPTQLKRYDLERISAGYAGTDHEMQEWLTGEWIKWDDLASWLKKAQEFV